MDKHPDETGVDLLVYFKKLLPEGAFRRESQPDGLQELDGLFVILLGPLKVAQRLRGSSGTEERQDEPASTSKGALKAHGILKFPSSLIRLLSL